MKKKRISKHKRRAITPEIPDWLLDDSPIPNNPLTKQDLAAMAAGVECGIRDTPAWKDLVSRVGEKEAARILKLALYSRQAIQSDPSN